MYVVTFFELDDQSGMMEGKIRTYETLNKLIKFYKIPICPKSSKQCNLFLTKNDNNEIRLEENTIPSHQNKSQIESGMSLAQLVKPTFLQKCNLII